MCEWTSIAVPLRFLRFFPPVVLSPFHLVSDLLHPRFYEMATPRASSRLSGEEGAGSRTSTTQHALDGANAWVVEAGAEESCGKAERVY